MNFALLFELLFGADIEIVFLHLKGFVVFFCPDDFLSLKGLNLVDLNPVMKEVLIEWVCWVSHWI